MRTNIVRLDMIHVMMTWAYLILCVACALVPEYVDARREKAMIRAAQNLELVEGVTLLQAVRAYYGEDGQWGVAQGKVFAFAGHSPSRRGDVRVNLETGEVMLYRGGHEGGKAESAALVKAMIQAAKRGERGPWPR